ncbi:hypothetical protein K0M31_017497 [Melipona bicolor]|uniref:Uncharacterized protein n=1 Tax=Melipona bicolor TaxID=60889 RepID=A0AA40G677_9HYME|nr:hypothetical protein K0M31_017497 [Melipona bicolor]
MSPTGRKLGSIKDVDYELYNGRSGSLLRDIRSQSITMYLRVTELFVRSKDWGLSSLATTGHLSSIHLSTGIKSRYQASLSDPRKKDDPYLDKHRLQRAIDATKQILACSPAIDYFLHSRAISTRLFPKGLTYTRYFCSSKATFYRRTRVILASKRFEEGPICGEKDRQTVAKDWGTLGNESEDECGEIARSASVWRTQSQSAYNRRNNFQLHREKVSFVSARGEMSV